MSVVLPGFPGPSSATYRYLDFGSVVAGGLGGAGVRFDRPGNRFAIDVVMPPLTLEPRTGWGDGYRVFLSRLRRAKREGALYPFPQQGFKLEATGTPVINGAVAANLSAIPVRGLTAGSVFREGQFVSIVHAGRRYVHSFMEERVAGVLGTIASIAVDPPLRVGLSDGDVIELIPLIEGDLKGDEVSWDVAASGQAPFSFSIEETE